jgi:hypothetical protein
MDSNRLRQKVTYDRTYELKLSDRALSVLRREVRAARLRLRRDTRIGLETPRRVVQLSEIDLPPVVRRYRLECSAREGGPYAVTSPSVRTMRIGADRRRPRNYRVDENIRRFWLTHAQDFVPFVTFSFIFERYRDWVDAQPVGGVYLRNEGLVGRHLSNITAESNEWTRVFVCRHCDMAAYNTFAAPSDTQPRHGGDYSVVAYKRDPIGAAPEL